MDKLEQRAYWQRTMTVPSAEPPADPDESAYEIPESARTQDQWGQDVPTVERLRALGQFAPEPVVARPAAALIDNSTIVGTHSARPRQNPSPWRAFDFGED
jgi:hypothetical protein